MDIGDIVYDAWWPWRVGRVIKRLKTRIDVCWADGNVWRHDMAHAKKFLRSVANATS